MSDKARTAQGIVDIVMGIFDDAMATTDPLRHCFREDSPTSSCRDCGQIADVHEGCDCEDDES